VEYIKRPKTKRGEKTLHKICEAAEFLFAEKGFYGTEIADITRRAGISAGTFYVYFTDKLSIFRHLMDELGHLLRKEIREAKEKQGPCSLMTTESLGLRTFLRFVSKHRGLFAIVWQSQFVDPESFKHYYERFSTGYITEIKNAQNRGEICSINPATLSYCLMGIYNFIALKNIIFDGKKPDDKTIDQIINFIRQGIETAPKKT
jgi:AcrR family transcriptional regulator